MARNLYVAVQPVVADACWPTSKMDFRSNEAGRTDTRNQSPAPRPGRFQSGQPNFVDATARGRRSFVTHHENRNAHSRLYRRAEALPRRLYHRPADQPGRARPRRRLGKANAEPSGPEAAHIKAQDKVTASGKKLADQEKFKREEHPFDAYPRLKQQALDNAPPNAGRQFSLALLRPVLCRAGAGFLHVPAADPERHHEALAVRRAGRSDRAAVRAVLPRHHAGESAGARNSRRRTRWR